METDSSNRKTILAMVGHYLPGNNAGGPIRSISNLVNSLGDEFDFLILTSDRDLRSPFPFEGIASGIWLPVGKAKVMYLSRKGLSVRNVWRMLRDMEYDLLYLNSFFARRFSMLPCILRWLGWISDTTIVLAPRGEFSQGAVKLKHLRKRAYIRLARLLGIYEEIVWHASSELERDDIAREFGVGSNICLASPIADANLSRFGNMGGEDDACGHIEMVKSATDLHSGAESKKKAGSARFCYLSRISPKKNLHTAIDLLDNLMGDIQYDIYGPIEDRLYWRKCEARIETVSANVSIEYKGEIAHERVGEVFSRYDFFLFPTLGENFGHAVVESLLAGCPVIISDRTPWRNLEASGIGWDIPLEDRDNFRKVLQECIDMHSAEYAGHSALARRYALEHCLDPEVLEQNRSLFTKYLRASPGCCTRD